MGKYIFSEAERLYRKLGTRDPYRLLGHLGAVIQVSDSFSEDGLKGLCTIQNRIKYVIINGKLSKPEQRIVAGHEAGHLVLHTNEIKLSPHQTLKDFYLYSIGGKMEYEANQFAADFLVGDIDVLECMEDGHMDHQAIASTLYIPPELLDFKLNSMRRRGHKVRPISGVQSKFLK